MASTLLTGLTNYWRLDETSGNAVDVIAGNNGVNTDVTYTIAKINNGAVFPSTNAGVLEFGSNVTPTSISFWLNAVEMFSGANGYSLLTSETPDNTIQGQSSTGRILIYDGTNRVGSNNWVTGQWAHYVFVYTTSGGNGYNVYLNGSFLEKITSNQVQVRRIGRSPNSFEGTVDELGMWSKQLTTDEITELYNNGIGKSYAFYQSNFFI
jgi:hypothetical protein